MKGLKVEVTFMEPVLGTSPANEDIYREYVASKAPDAITMREELEEFSVDEVVDKGMTVFPKLDDGTPFLWDYQIKGFFKSACSALRGAKNSESAKIKAYKKKIDLDIFISHDFRRIPFQNYGEICVCQRPLRAQTAQGERTALAISEEIPAGAKISFNVEFIEDYTKAVKEWLSYGKWNGIGQWRNSGKGRFRVDSIEEYETDCIC